jgi:AraC-like DNA-binding protein
MCKPLNLLPRSAHYFLLTLRRFGATDTLREAIVEGCGLTADQAEERTVKVGFRQHMRQVDNLNRLLGEGWLVTAPELWRPPAHGVLGMAVTNAPTLAEALALLRLELQSALPFMQFSVVEDGTMGVVRFVPTAEIPESQLRHLTELILLGVASAISWLPRRPGLAFDYQWPEPAYGAKLAAALGGPVRWWAGSSAVIVPARLLGLRSPMADPILYREILGRLATLAQGAPESVAGRLTRLLARSESARLSMAAAAAALELSERTLARRLAEEGASYRDLADAELKARARRLLDAGALSRAEIAERLGFSDATGFSRACRRWFGRTT